MPTERKRGARQPEAETDVLKYLARSLPGQWRAYRGRLKRCREHFSEKRVHKTRTEIRRLLATTDLLRVFLSGKKLKPVRRTLKKHLDAFDQLRDTQVQLAYVTRLPRSFSFAPEFRNWLMKREDRFRRKTRRAVKQIKTKRLHQRLAGIQAELESLRTRQGVAATLNRMRRALALAYARVEQLRRGIVASDISTIHRTRVAFKHFRYMIEALGPLYPASNEERRRAMQDYQTMMGDIQDAEVLLITLDKCLRNRKRAPDSARALRREMVKRRRRLIEVYLSKASKLDEFRPLSVSGSAFHRRRDLPVIARNSRIQCAERGRKAAGQAGPFSGR